MTYLVADATAVGFYIISRGVSFACKDIEPPRAPRLCPSLYVRFCSE